ncbi:MAG: glutamate racemase [Chloroflexi bacterium]|nr:glutamate racemase [Chloroflexota bacterium]
MNTTAPIGVFDSGVGGLSVLHDIRAVLPNEDLIYVADSGHVPYGSKSQEYIQERSIALTRFLIEQGAKTIVVACNTATAAAATRLRSVFSLPIVAMEPAVKPAAAATRSAVIGVLATVGTIKSAQLAALLERFGQGIEVVTQPCPGLVEQVEAGDLDGPETRTLVERFTAPLMQRSVDTIVLGCTHYPFLCPLIADVVGADVALIDTGAAVARQLQRVLSSHDLLNQSEQRGSEQFWTSGDLRDAPRVFSCLWGRSAEVRRLPEQFL